MEQPLNILLITARADFGGGPEHMFRILRLLSSRINFFVACPPDYPYYPLYKQIVGDENVIAIPHREFKMSALFRLAWFIKRKKINLIHSHGKGAGIYSRLLSLLTFKKCIHTFHGIHLDNYKYLQKILYLKIERLLSLLTEKFISVSASESEKAVGLNIASKDKINVIYNGTPIPEQTSVFSFPYAKTYNIVTITRFDYAKNSLLLIPICRELIKLNSNLNFRFLVLGSGEEEDEFKRQLYEEKLEGFFNLTGFVLNTGEYLKDSFCYISTSRWEGMPLGVLEAMSYGLPVIATDVTGNKDLVEQEVNGFLFNIDSPDEAAKYILRLSGNENEYKFLSENGRKMVQEKYSLKQMAEETYNLYLAVK
ncbi:MAG: glycosyltransferase family 1 protein [Ignavibacteriales bacterium]|nr:MAG: glycosyltransferase family 1 protein [Ignavibacteriales bacterium]